MDFSLESIQTNVDKLKASILITKFYFELCKIDTNYSRKQKLKDYIKGINYNSDITTILLVKSNGIVIGIVMYSTSIKEITWIEWLYILPKYRHQGIATSVLDIVRSLEENKPLTLVTLSNNENGLNFYHDYGFKTIGTSEKYGYSITELYFEDRHNANAIEVI